MNQKGEVTTAVAAIGTIVIIIIIILAIYTLSGSVQEEGSPMYENFLEILNIFKSEAQTEDVASAEEAELIQTFESFTSSIEECESYSNKESCGCSFTEDEIPEGAFILIKNLDEGFALATATSELVQPVDPKTFPSKKLGIFYLDYDNNEFGCYFPESFFIRSQIQKKYDSVWYVDMGNSFKHFYRVISLNRYWDRGVESGELDNFHMIYFIDSLEITEDSAIFRYKKEKGNVNVLVGEYEYFTIAFNHNGKKWKYSKSNSEIPSSSYKNLWSIGKGDSHYKIKEKLKDMNKKEGLEVITQLKENLEKLNPDTSGDIVVPNLYKIDEDTYCLSTEILWYNPYDLFDLKAAREKGQTKTMDTGYIYLGEALGYLQSTEYCHG